MPFVQEFGSLHEPLAGRSYGPDQILELYAGRVSMYAGLGVSPGDCVFLHYGNTAAFFVDLLAIWHLGACAVPIDPRFTAFQIANAANLATPRISVWADEPTEDTRGALNRLGVRIISATDRPAGNTDTLPPALTNPDADALILFTSGTTGQPKGVVHTHRSLRNRWMSLRDCLGTENFVRSLCLLPTHFGHGLICNCLFPWLSGEDLFLMPPFRPDVLMQLGEVLDRQRISFMSSVPAMWRMATRMAKPPETRSLRLVHCGSAPLGSALWQSIADWTGAGEVANAYGITEVGSWLAGTTGLGLPPADGLVGRGWGSDIRVLKNGRPDSGVEDAEQCAPGEPGHIWVSTPALMRGYLGRDDLTAEVVSRGWFSTRDIGVVDERGILFLLGRERDEINKGGMKVHPADIDSALERFEGTRDVCAFAYADPLLGENVGVAVVLDESSASAVSKLHKTAERDLARHQIPQRWYIVDAIPRTSRGKVDRRAVAERCADLDPVPFDHVEGEQDGAR
jgi:acyl-CoA synthetase (AMP-forming)/AMP-acid ligase II